MHNNSMEIMARFVKEHDFKGATVVDIGSRDVNGNYRELFPESRYIGVDIVAGLNVDIIMDSPEWNELKDVDAVISGQTLEHVADIPKLMASMFRILRIGGILCVIAPSAGPPHDYPIWVGNFSIERMSKEVSDAGFQILSCTISNVEPFKDCCCIAVKGMQGRRSQGKSMKISNFSLCIGIPLTFPMVPSGFFYSFTHMEKPKEYTLLHADNGSGSIDALRNDLVNMALQMSATHLILMDTDQIYPVETIPKLLSHKLPIVGCVVNRRYPPFDPILLRGKPGGYESIDEWEQGSLLDVDATGTGCLMFSTEIFRSWNLWAQAEIDAFNALRPTAKEMECLPNNIREYFMALEKRCVHPNQPGKYFKFRNLKSGEGIGEDIGFCYDLKKMGKRIFVDTSIQCGHLTTLNITMATYKLYKSVKIKEHKQALERALNNGETK